jgi:hypothetical protein
MTALARTLAYHVLCLIIGSVSTAAPLLTVSVPLALAPDVSCDQDRTDHGPILLEPSLKVASAAM